MDITTLIGVVAAFACLIVGVFWGGGTLGPFMDPSSIFITIGGTIAGVLASYSLSDFVSLPKIFSVSFKKVDYNAVNGINAIVSLANVARKEGMLALEENVGSLDDEFVKKGIMLVVDATDQELVKNIMEAEIGAIESRHQRGQAMVEQIGSLGPAYGMLGTLIGLIIMLGNMDDPSSLGGGMAAALITTLYGSIIANVFAIPIVAKLKTASGLEILYKEIMLEGILSIQAGENPRIIEEKLYSFLPRNAKAATTNDSNDKDE